MHVQVGPRDPQGVGSCHSANVSFGSKADISFRTLKRGRAGGLLGVFGFCAEEGTKLRNLPSQRERQYRRAHRLKSRTSRAVTSNPKAVNSSPSLGSANDWPIPSPAVKGRTSRTELVVFWLQHTRSEVSGRITFAFLVEVPELLPHAVLKASTIVNQTQSPACQASTPPPRTMVVR